MKVPIVLKQGHPIHRANEDGRIHHPVVEGRFVDPRGYQTHGEAAHDVLNELFHAEVYNG